ncbi:hypothetical protein SS50377_28345 [Spironucleus salmonicida]|uniref:Uncharacterized protein n=1 Tax=Spironucleus salmonicida TaxID=348837 RepID=V6LLR5_9EUKA|nr:hypothetical protein SS50377_28345 [Spironucleus salmonicida]|eukprot:EST45557.1 hypothetical protein SS50377_14522 [Spironucleus salmonicida]
MPQIPTNILDTFTVFKNSAEVISPDQKTLSLEYIKEREFLLQANVCRIQSLTQLQDSLPSYVTQQFTVPTAADFGLTELCLPQTNNYDAMPDHKWKIVRQKIIICCDPQSINQVIDDAESKYLYMGWHHLREGLMSLGRRQLRKALWERAAPKVPEKENFPMILEIIDEEEAEELKQAYWPYYK